MRLSKTHFRAFVTEYKGEDKSVTGIRSAYQTEMNKRDAENKISSKRMQLVPMGKSDITLAGYGHDGARYHKIKREVTRKTGLTNGWVALQLRKMNYNA